MAIAIKPHFQMADVGAKAVTDRKAVARGTLLMNRGAFDLLRSNRLPKGDALKLGEAAGLLAAKRTPDSIPLCHPIPLDKIRVWFHSEGALLALHAFCEVSARAKTGVEMEALSGATGALLTVYDLVKPVDPALTITDVRLIYKEGGKSGMWHHPDESQTSSSFPHSQTSASTPGGIYPPSAAGKDVQPLPAAAVLGNVLPRAHRRESRGNKELDPRPSETLGRAAVITVSDRCFAGSREDLSGPILVEGLKSIGFKTGTPVIVPDEKKEISKLLWRLARRCDVILLTGGTGLSPRDVTPEAVESACDKLVPGIGEALRLAGVSSTPMSSLSRSVAGQMGETLVVALPGSVDGVRDGLKVLASILPHAAHIMKGGNHEH